MMMEEEEQKMMMEEEEQRWMEGEAQKICWKRRNKR